MKIINAVICGITLLASSCGGGGGGGGSADIAIPTDPIQITEDNATTVATGAVGTSQSMVSTGNGQAALVGVVAQNTGRTRSVANISLFEFRRIGALQFAPVVSGASINQTYPCANSSGSFTLDFQDLDASSSLTVGDIFTLSFDHCLETASVGMNSSTTNGSVTYVINNSSGPLNFGAATGTPQSPFTAGFTITFNNFTSTDNVTGLTNSISGDVSFSTSDDGTYTTGTMFGTSLRVVDSVDGSFLMTGYNLSFTEANFPTYITPYSFSVTMTIASVMANGAVSIATGIPIAGVGFGDPTSGAMRITGANGSTLDVTALADGIHVRLVVDDDGAAGPNVPVTVTNPATQTDYTWAEL